MELLIARSLKNNYNDNDNVVIINQLLPGQQLACYHELKVDVKTFSNLEDDQFIKVTYHYLTFNEEYNNKHALIFGDKNQFVVNSGMVGCMTGNQNNKDQYKLLSDVFQEIKP